MCGLHTALAVLDILKKAEQPLCSQAREAIRWLERQLSPNEEAPARPQQRQNVKPRTQLRILDDDDMLTWFQVLEESFVPPACLDDPTDGQQVVQMWKQSLQSLSLRSQVTLRALLGSTDDIRSPIVAIAEVPRLSESQSDLIERLLVDPESLQESMKKHFPSIPLDQLLPVSSEDVAKVVEDEAAFHTLRQSRSEQKTTGVSRRTAPLQSRNGSEKHHNRDDSGFQQSRTRTPNSSKSSERSIIRPSSTPSYSPPANEPQANIPPTPTTLFFCGTPLLLPEPHKQVNR